MASRLGAVEVMVAPPRRPDWTRDELREHFGRVVAATSGSVMIQDAPFATGVELGVEFVLELAESFSNVGSYKVEALPYWSNAVRARQVAGERLLILKDGHCLREETLAFCDRARARFAGQIEAEQFLTIFELIRAGFGVSIVPEMARSLSAGCRLIGIEPKASRRIGYIRLERRYVSKALEAFTGFLREAARERK